MRKKFWMNLQLFAEPAGGAGGTEPPTVGQGQQTQPSGGQPRQHHRLTIPRSSRCSEGTLAAKEDTALKAYFKTAGAQPGGDGAGNCGV